MNKKAVVAPIVVIVLVLAGWLLVYTPRISGPASEKTGIVIPKQFSVVSDTVEGPLMKSGYPVYTAEYHVPAGLPGSDVFIAEFKKMFETLAVEYDKDRVAEYDSFETASQGDDYVETVTVEGLTPNKQCVVFADQGYVYNIGAAHGNTTKEYRTFCLDGSRPTIADFFADKTAALKIISESVRAQLLSDSGKSDQGFSFSKDDTWFIDGTAPTEQNYGTNVALTEDGVSVLFSQYAIAAYAYGEFKVVVPYTAPGLRALINPKFLD